MRFPAVSVAATSGSGKSFLVNFLAQNYYGAGAKIRIVDIGGSYKKTAKMIRKKHFLAVIADVIAMLSVLTTLGPIVSTANAASEMPKRERAVVSKMVSPTRFEMVTDSGRQVKIRLIGVASPGVLQMMGASLGQGRQEHASPTRDWHKKAKEAVGGRISPGTAVTIEYDPFKRTWKGKSEHEMAYVWLANGKMLNEWIVQEGWGEVSVSEKDRWKSDYIGLLRAAQKSAREAKKGFWT